MAEAARIQMEKLFNTSESVLKTWIAKFLGNPPEELFDSVPDVVEPVLFYPSEHSHGKYVELKLGIVDSKYQLNIDELLQEKLVCDTIQFFIYSVRIVYGSIMKTSERGPAHDVVLEWDATTMTFVAEYMPDLKKKYIYYNHVLGHMMNARETLPEDKAVEWQADFARLMADIGENTASMESENVNGAIEEKRLEWADLDRVGVLVRYITEDEIPSEFKLDGLKSIAESRYEEPVGPDETSGSNGPDDSDAPGEPDEGKYEDDLGGTYSPHQLSSAETLAQSLASLELE